MRFETLSQSRRLLAMALLTVFLVACGEGDGPERIVDQRFIGCGPNGDPLVACPLDPVPPPPPPLYTTRATIFSETSTTDPAIAYNRIINSIDFGLADTPSDVRLGNPENVNVDANTVAVAPYDGEVWEIDYQDTPGGAFGGALIDLGAGDDELVDISAYDTLKFSINRSQFPDLVDLTIQFDPPGAGGAVLLSSLAAPVINGDWETYFVSFGDFSGFNPASVNYLGFWNASDGVNPVYGKLYLDDIHLTDGTNTAGIISETHTVTTLAYNRFINSVIFGFPARNTPAAIVNVNPDTLDTAVAALAPFDGEVLQIVYNIGNASGALFDFGPGDNDLVDISAYSALKFSINATQVPAFSSLDVQMEPPSFPAASPLVPLSNYVPTLSNGWATYTIPLSDFEAQGLVLTGVNLLGFWNPDDATDTRIAGTFYFDDIHLLGP